MDDEVTQRLRALFLGIAPERTKELEKLWDRYGPVVLVVPDDDLLVMEAGLYRYLRFNHRMLRMIWLLSFSAWEGYVMIHNATTTGELGDAAEQFKAALETAIAVSVAKNPLSVTLPSAVPEPGPTDVLPVGSTARAAGEIAIFAVGWAFLHEIRHLIHQQDDTAGGEAAAERHAEELSCDDYATRFLLEQVENYAKDRNEPEAKVAFKRQLGIYFALYALAVIGRGKWDASESHPAIQTRMDQALATMNAVGFSKGAAVIASASFAALNAIFKDVPSPLGAISRQAVTEKWDDSSFAYIGVKGSQP